jgi:hypothetical protein
MFKALGFFNLTWTGTADIQINWNPKEVFVRSRSSGESSGMLTNGSKVYDLRDANKGIAYWAQIFDIDSQEYCFLGP